MTRGPAVVAIGVLSLLGGLAYVAASCDDDVPIQLRDPEVDAASPLDAGDAGGDPEEELLCEIVDSGLPSGSFDVTYVNGHKAFPKVATGPTDAGPAQVAAIFTTKTAAVDRGGRVWIIGTADKCASQAAVNDLAIMRLDVLGNVDLFFGGGTGYRCYDFAGAKEVPTSAAFDSEDRLVIGGAFVSVANNGRPFVIRLTDDGALDPKFGNAGVVADFFPGPGNPTVYGVTVDGDGILVSGGDLEPEKESTKGFVAHIEVNGSIDSAFNNGTGIYTRPDVRGFRAGHVKTPKDGSILVPGALAPDGWSLFALSPAGAEVLVVPSKPIPGAGTSQGPQGIVLGRNLPTETGHAALVAGSIGGTPPSAAAIRFSDDPKAAATAAGNPSLIPALRWDVSANFQPLVRQCDGKGVVVAANGSPLRPSLARFDEITGALDPTYGNAGTLAITAVDAGPAVSVGYGALLIDSHTNRVVVVASSSQKNGPFVYRLNP